MRKRKGIALPTAVMMCVLLLAISFTTTFFVLQNQTLSKLEEMYASYRLEFLEQFTRFQQGTPGSLTGIESEHLKYTSFQKDTTNIYALVGRNAGGKMMAYGIYDFDTSKVLAYQDQDFYFDGEGKLGGVIDIGGVA